MTIANLPDEDLHELLGNCTREHQRRYYMRLPNNHATFCEWIMPLRNWFNHHQYSDQVVALGQATLNKGLPRFWHADEAVRLTVAAARPERPASQHEIYRRYMEMTP